VRQSFFSHCGLAVAACLVLSTSLLAQDYVPPEEMDAQTLYGLSCASCHGIDGGGLSPDNPLYQSFDSPPADLTDALFNSREPAADWAIVIKHGGARIGLSSQMPAFGEAFSDEQIEQLVTYIKTLADTERYPPGDLNFLRPIDTIKAFPEDEALLLNRYVDGDNGAANSFRTTIYYGRRFGARHQGEIKLAQIRRGGESELDEAEIGWKWAVKDNLEEQSLFSLGIEAAFPIDDDDASEEIIPYFSFAKGLSDALTFQGMLKGTLPVDDVDKGEVKLSGIVHWMRSEWPRGVFPALEATITSPLSKGDTEATLIPQLYFGLSKLGHVALAVGVELPLTDLDYEYRIHSFLLWDLADGMLWDGW
jgi:cytochrome c553